MVSIEQRSEYRAAFIKWLRSNGKKESLTPEELALLEEGRDDWAAGWWYGPVAILDND